MFSPESSENEIIERVKELNTIKTNPQKDCVLIASHDKWNTRKPIYKDLKSILEITCAGKWKNNTEELWKKYSNDKVTYLKNFKFNICPENTNSQGYVTEKIFEAFLGGCILIYYGSDNNPEPDILNKDAILFWEMNSKNDNLINEVKKILANRYYYDIFAKQPKFSIHGANYVIEKFKELKKKLKEMTN